MTDQQRLIDCLVSDAANTTCPACGGKGFWDNRTDPKQGKGPDFRCKNKACPGPRGARARRPLGVWLPEPVRERPVEEPTPPPPAEEAPWAFYDQGEDASPYELAELAPDAGPPDADRDSADKYLALWDRVAKHHLPWMTKGIMVTDQGINATTYSIWSGRR